MPKRPKVPIRPPPHAYSLVAPIYTYYTAYTKTRFNLINILFIITITILYLNIRFFNT